MTVLKRTALIAVSFVLALSLVLLAAGWLLDDSTLVSLVVQRVEAVTDTRIQYDDAALSRGWNPELRLDNLRIEDREGAYQATSRSLRVQLSLPRLLLGQLDIPQLLVGDTRVVVAGGKADSAPAGDARAVVRRYLSVLRLRPVLHKVQIAALRVQLQGEKLSLPASRISELSLHLAPGGEVPELSAQIQIRDEKLRLEATLPDVKQALDQVRLPFSLVIDGAIARTSVEGYVELDPPASRVHAEVRARVADLARLRHFGVPVDVPGELGLSGLLEGPVRGPALEQLSAEWEGPGDSGAKLKGRIGELAALSGLDLRLTAKVERADWLGPVLPASLGGLEHARLAAHLGGGGGRVEIRDAELGFESTEGLKLSLAGRLDLASADGASQPADIDLALLFSAPTTRAARMLLFEQVPEFGAIEGRGHFRSPGPVPALENVVVKTRDPNGIRVDLEGRIARFPLDPERPNEGYALDVTMKSRDTALMAARAGLELPLAGPLELAYRIEGDTRALRLSGIRLSAGERGQTRLRAGGSLRFGDWDDPRPLKGIDLDVDLEARDTAFLKAWSGQELPALAWNMHARLHTVDGIHRVDDFRLATAKGQPLAISAKGSARAIRFLPAFALEGIDLDLQAKAADLVRLGPLLKLGWTPPAIGALRWRSKVTGSDRALLLDDTSIELGRKDRLQLQANGRLGRLGAAQNWRLTDTSLALTARADSSRALARLLGYTLPSLGPLSAKARVVAKGPTLRLESLKATVGAHGSPVLESGGTVGDLLALRKVHIETRLKLDREEVARLMDLEAGESPGEVSGSLLLADAGGRLGIQSLRVRGGGSALFDIDIEGRYPDFDKPETARLKARLDARDMKLVGALVGREWRPVGPVHLRTELKQSGKRTLVSGGLQVAGEQFDLALQADLHRKPAHLSGTITADEFYLPDPFETMAAERKAREKNGGAKRGGDGKAGTRGPVFSREDLDLGWMKKLDADLLFDIRSFDRTRSRAVSGRVGLKLNGGLLEFSPATIVYPKGRLRVHFRLDGRGVPAFRLSASGDALNPWMGLGMAGNSDKDFDVRNAQLDIEAALQSQGSSPHQLAANLDGSFYLHNERGKISRARLDLLFVNLVGWLYKAGKERYYRINCGILDLDVRKGVIDTRAFFLDSPAITIGGEGTVDLGKETVDYVFVPKKKSRIIAKAEPVKITGPLNDPRVKAIPVKSAALTFGTLIFAPYVFAGMVAADYASSSVNKYRSEHGDVDSACRAYEAEHEKATEKKREKPGARASGSEGQVDE
ncbi:MAG TPA: hypothetical protein ENK05_00270 [Gammaproteobacteria bacterium]|nr:hypothetical protein [Gammaproteobacteria bacterium]